MQNVSPTVLLLTSVHLFHFCILFFLNFVSYTVPLLLFESLNFSRKTNENAMEKVNFFLFREILFTNNVGQCYK